MILSDTKILEAIEKGEIKISPFNINQLQGSSYDVTLSPYLAIYQKVIRNQILDTKKLEDFKLNEFTIPDDGYVLKPGLMYLGSTIEKTIAGNNIVPQIQGKSSTGRAGINIHITAGYGDPGWGGHWTLEIEVPHPIRIYKNLLIGQVFFTEVKGSVERLYTKKRSHYQDQNIKPVASKIYKQYPNNKINN